MASDNFLGRYFHSIDDKGRVAIPHKFRTGLGGVNDNRVVVTLSPNEQFSYLDIYPSSRWDAMIGDLMSAQFEDEDPILAREALLANYVHPAQEVELDRQGRILLPQEHREFAGMEKEVVYTGDGRKFRLWARPEWERYDAQMKNERGRIRKIQRPWL